MKLFEQVERTSMEQLTMRCRRWTCSVEGLEADIARGGWKGVKKACIVAAVELRDTKLYVTDGEQ